MTREQLVKYLKKTEFDVQGARCCYYLTDLYFTVYANASFFGKNLSPLFGYVITLNSQAAFYEIIPKEVLHEFSEGLYRAYLENPENLISKMNERDELHEEIEVIWSQYRLVDKTDFFQIAEFFQRLVGKIKKWIEYAAIGEDKWQIIDQEFIPEFSKKNNISEAQAKNILAIISHPAKRSVFNIERENFLEMCLDVLSNNVLGEAAAKKDLKAIRRDPVLSKKMEKYISQYFWLKTDFYGFQEITLASLLNDIANFIADKNEAQINKELEKISQNILLLKKEKQKVLSELKINQQDRRVFDLVAQAISWHDKRKEDMTKQFYYMYSVVADLAVAAQTTYDQIVVMSLQELDDFLATGIFKLKKSEKTFTMFAKGKPSQIFVGEIADEMLGAVLKIELKKEFSGTVASKGGSQKLTGRVKIISDPRNESFKKGEILVTSMTRVEFVPLMRKAKAIITDEGGIACHAAIISRELGIPCIIGTKIATEVLKDGNWVEMDTDKGIVKILEKAK